MRITPEKLARLQAVKDATAAQIPLMTPDEIRAALWAGITQKHSGKMEGLASFSTCCAINPRCRSMAENPALICSKCYAAALLAMRSGLAEKSARNSGLMASRVLPQEAFPVLPWSRFRLEAFGDLENSVQAVNYLQWAMRCPETVFAWWTKHPGTVRLAMSQLGLHELPGNVNLIYSVPVLDPGPALDPGPEASRLPSLAGAMIRAGLFATFEVHTDPGPAQNCPKSCRDCLRCYTRRTPGAAPVRIIEKLK